ncbi:MAG: NAD(P)H-dependent glycerol-3-phosphate dehydrogenase [Candidatus Omnitrophota bacterium]
MNDKKIAVIGDGGWGTTLAIHLYKKGFRVSLWSAFEEYADILIKTRENAKFLPGIKIPQGVEISHSLKSVAEDAGLVILAVPSQYLREVLLKLKKEITPEKYVFLSVIKGLEIGTMKRMSEVIYEILGKIKLAVLSGPTIAREVAHETPSAAVVSSTDKSTAEKIQDIIMSDYFRIYTNYDLIGVELGGALKNIIAIACGISDGMGCGTNTKAAILTRGLAEMARMGTAMGAKKETFWGLSGMGDLVTTCSSSFSRNRFVGEEIGCGKKITDILSGMHMVAEGVKTCDAAHQLAKIKNIDAPITEQIYLVLHKNKKPEIAVKDLMCRKKKEEKW